MIYAHVCTDFLNSKLGLNDVSIVAKLSLLKIFSDYGEEDITKRINESEDLEKEAPMNFRHSKGFTRWKDSLVE